MRIFLFAIFFSVLPKLYAQTMGVSVMAEHSPMDISAFNAVISKQLNEPVVSSASAFLKFGFGLDFRVQKLTLSSFLNSIASSKETRLDTSYGFQNFRFEVNLGYQVLQKEKLVIEPFLGWALNNTSYNKTYDINYPSLTQYWTSPLNYKFFGFNLHNINAGLRFHFKKYPVNENAEIGFSLRTGFLIPLGNGKMRFSNQKISSDQKLVQQTFYIGLICTLSGKPSRRF
jgi:hypothetical protein